VSNPDDHVDKALGTMFSADDAEAPDREARRRAIAMARSEFEQVQEEKASKANERPQGLIACLRLIVTGNDDNGRSIMPFSKRFAYSGVGAVAVGAIAVGLTLQNRTAVQTEASGLERSFAYHSPFSTGAETPRPAARPDASVAAEIALPRAKRVPKAEFRSDLIGQSTGGNSRQAEPIVLEERIVSAQKRQRTAFVPAAMSSAGVSPDAEAPASPHYEDVGRDQFEAFEENRVKLVSDEPVSTFSADVDTASYSFVRRMLNNGVLPQGDAVRAEEMINYFDYSYALPATRSQPFAPTVTVTDSPWADGRKLMHIGIKGYDIAPGTAPRSNLVFLLDVSGSMNNPNKLPLVKQSMELLLSTLKPDDTVAIAVYAGAAGTVLEPTKVSEKQKILDAMQRLKAGGSTAGAQGVRLAYELAATSFDSEAVNRVILATDGDFNVGITDQRELKSFIERKREEGIYLSVLGFGQGNYRDALMQTLAQNGNGTAAYIDTLSEAQKVLVEEATSTLFPIARDVKFQVEFNPAAVSEYRLIGYETRHLNREDFNNDAVDAGDIGAGHTVTAIYEFTPTGSDARYFEERRYLRPAPMPSGSAGEYAFLKIRYKLPEEDTSRLITRPVTRADEGRLTGDTGFATAVAGFAQVLKGGKYVGDYSYDDVIELALKSRGDDAYGYRTEFVQLARKAKTAAAMQRR